VVVEQSRSAFGPLQVVVSDTRSAFARISHALAGCPSESLPVVAIAGAHGKTTTGLFLRAILEAAGQQWSLIGPSEWVDGTDRLRCGPMTPGPEGLCVRLAESLERGDGGAVVAASSTALEQRGLDGLQFFAVLVTHLGDSSREEIRRRRVRTARLLKGIMPGGVAVLPADDPNAEPLGGVNLRAERIIYGLDRPANTAGVVDRALPTGSIVRLHGLDRDIRVRLRLIGMHNLRYALAAAALAQALGLRSEVVATGLEAVSEVPGRLEGIDQGQDFQVWVDRARTGATLSRALEAVRWSAGGGRVHCVIGAPGGGTRADRQALGQAAECGADHILFTSDNPLDEDPGRIVDDLRSGLSRPDRIHVELDRRAAIEMALASAAPGDAVLIAGKGRDTFQIEGHQPTAFNDHAIASAWLARHASPPHRRSA
jgi:UDP-N-acetylmuramoyl-L-alanyl-D-glutamate--2,6-diaminopimelate ligase